MSLCCICVLRGTDDLCGGQLSSKWWSVAFSFLFMRLQYVDVWPSWHPSHVEQWYEENTPALNFFKLAVSTHAHGSRGRAATWPCLDGRKWVAHHPSISITVGLGSGNIALRTFFSLFRLKKKISIRYIIKLRTLSLAFNSLCSLLPKEFWKRDEGIDSDLNCTSKARC